MQKTPKSVLLQLIERAQFKRLQMPGDDLTKLSPYFRDLYSKNVGELVLHSSNADRKLLEKLTPMDILFMRPVSEFRRRRGPVRLGK
jgi:hypothetical protein